MKRLILFLFTLSALSTACTREAEIIGPDEIPAPVEEQHIIPDNIPTVLHAAIANESEAETEPEDTETRTNYDEDGKFSWSGNETVALLLYQNDDHTVCKYLKAVNYTTTDSGRSADFTLDENSLFDGHTAPETGWLSTGIAVYPYGMTNDHTPSTYANEYGEPFIKIRSSVKFGSDSDKRTGDSSEIILLGTPDGDHFSFKTAMAILKVTMTGIPANATALQLYTTDQNNYPLTGDFKLHISGDKEIKCSDYTLYRSAHTGDPYISIDLSSDGAIDSRDFYFNIPTGTYPANTLKMRLLDSENNVLMQKSIQKKFTFNRNDMVKATLTVPSPSSVSAGGYATAPGLYTQKGVNVSTIRVNISASKLTDSNYSKSEWREGNKFGDDQNGWNLTNLTSNGTNKILSTAASGLYYINYIACSTGTQPDKLTDNQVLAYGSAPLYYITEADAAARCGHYDYAFGTIAPEAMKSKSEEASITFAVSKDASKGNMMITEFGGYSYIAKWSSNTTINVTAATNGTPVYGLYTSSNANTGNYPGIVCNNTFDNFFFKDGSGTQYFLGEKDYPNQLRFGFDNDAYSTGSTKDAVCWGGKATLFYTANKSSTKIEVQKYCVNKSLIKQCTITSNSTSGSDSASQMADGAPETFWHSVWDGARPWDETYGVYFTIQLPSALSSFKLSYCTRHNNINGVPRAFKYWTSSDGITWTAISENAEDVMTDVTTSGTRVDLPSVNPSTSFSYIRVRVVKSGPSATELTSSSGFTSIAELQLTGTAAAE